MENQLRLIEIFKDTREKSRTDDKLKIKTLEMQAGTSIYLEGFKAVMRNEKSDGKIYLSKQIRPFHVRRKMYYMMQRWLCLTLQMLLHRAEVLKMELWYGKNVCA